MDRKTYWFGRKRFGIGFGPVAWQGWVLILAYVVAMRSISWFTPRPEHAVLMIAASAVALGLALWKFHPRA